MTKAAICLIEDDWIMGESIQDRIQLEGYNCVWYRSVEEAQQAILSGGFELVISDIRLPEYSGDQFYLTLVEQKKTLPPFIFMSAYADVHIAVALMKAGAVDLIIKPFDLSLMIEKICALLDSQPSSSPPDDLMLGQSLAIKTITDVIPRLAQNAKTILLQGESGVGKEYVARAIHAQSGNKETPFIAINCGAISDNLVESELFGHEKGAFTDAIKQRKGAFELAEGGTLFLDEIGEAPLSLQVKLLRVIQERSIVRVGGHQPIAVNIRLILATHRDLFEMVNQGSFREDLYYRIQVISLKIPPLRERQEDILWFAHRFLTDYAQQHKEPIKQLEPSLQVAMQHYVWPGNVRQLYNAIERACILSPQKLLVLADFPEVMHGCGLSNQQQSTHSERSLSDYLSCCERAYIISVLKASGWQMAQTAHSLGISRKNLWEKMKKLSIEAPAS